jgi:hypothetical protein
MRYVKQLPKSSRERLAKQINPLLLAAGTASVVGPDLLHEIKLRRMASEQPNRPTGFTRQGSPHPRPPDLVVQQGGQPAASGRPDAPDATAAPIDLIGADVGL